MKKNKTGLVLEGGAMRGLFTAGVLDVLMSENITFDGAIGVSAGACFGVNYKSQQIGRTIRYNLKYASDPRYGSLKNALKNGNAFDKDFCYHIIPNELDPFDKQASLNNPMPFISVATDIKTGQAVYTPITDGNEKELEYIRASAAMPLVSEIVSIDNYLLLDGGIVDSIPLHYLQKQGYQRNVIVLTQPRDYVKKKNKFLPLIKKKYASYPALIEAIAHRHEHYNDLTKEIKELELSNDVFVIQPEEPLHISSLTQDTKEMIRVYELGRQAANKKLEALKKYLD